MNNNLNKDKWPNSILGKIKLNSSFDNETKNFQAWTMFPTCHPHVNLKKNQTFDMD
jgi:hypothetical protein